MYKREVLGRNYYLVLLAVMGIGAFLLCFSLSAHAAIYNASGMVGHADQSGNPLYAVSGANNGPNPQGLNGPADVALDTVNHRLFVADPNNARVLVYLLDGTNNFISSTPTYVLGQSDFYSDNVTVSQNHLAYPDGLAYDQMTTRLFVSDQTNNRVLVFNVATSTITNGENASNVLGQSNYATSTSTTTQGGLSSPYGLAYDASTTRLFVSDQGNNRILVFNVATSTIASGENASSVIGQTDFATPTANTSQNGLTTPYGLALNPSTERLFVSDQGNNRILYFNVATSQLQAAKTHRVSSAKQTLRPPPQTPRKTVYRLRMVLPLIRQGSVSSCRRRQ